MAEWSINDLGYDLSLSRGDLFDPSEEDSPNNVLNVLSNTVAVGDYQGGLVGDMVEGVTEQAASQSGTQTASVNMPAGDIHSGKASVTDTAAGFWIGTNGTSSTAGTQMSVGTSASGFDWNVTTANVLTITGAGLVSPIIRYGKTSFSDATHAGYYISTEGVYAGSVSDASYLKYGIAAATFGVQAAIVTLAGSVINLGTIAGWTLSSTSLTATSGGNTTIVSSDTTAFTAGPTGTPTFTVTQAGALTATSGVIGGWTIGATTLSATGIILDAGNQKVTVGSSTPNITIDGTNKTIQTSTYGTGTQGWRITKDGDAEFNNLFARGEFHTQVLSYDSVHVTAGSSLLAYSGGTLKNDANSSTAGGDHLLLETGDRILAETGDSLLTEGVSPFNVDINDPPSGHIQVFLAGDILRVKDGSGNDNWWTVASVTDMTTYFRYNCSLSSGSTANFYAGAAIADYGQSGQGMIYSTADGTNGPYISVQTHAGAPWTTITEHVRMGNLNGFVDYVADIYGLAIGSSNGTDANICIDPTNGIRIRCGTANKVLIDNAGNATFYGVLSAATGTLGALTITTGGNIKLGQTAYQTGTGFWLGDDSGTAKVSFGTAGGNCFFWDGTILGCSGVFTGNIEGNISKADLISSSISAGRMVRIRGNSIDGDSIQPIESIGFFSTGDPIGPLILSIGYPSVLRDDYWMIVHTPTTSLTPGLIESTTATTADWSTDAAFGIIKLSASDATGKVNLLSLVNAGNGRCLAISQTHASPTYAPIVVSGGLTSTKFRRLIAGSNRTIWESIDTTVPNTALSGTAGDLCMCGDGNVYRCTGTTNWSAM